MSSGVKCAAATFPPPHRLIVSILRPGQSSGKSQTLTLRYPSLLKGVMGSSSSFGVTVFSNSSSDGDTSEEDKEREER